MSGVLQLDVSDVEKLQTAIKDYGEGAEQVINEVLHNQAGELIQESVKRLMPTSNKKWRGKAPAAKTSNSLATLTSNLAVTVTTGKKYQYLYFPNDGSNTRRHVGNQQFFARGAEAVKDEIIERCISRLNNFE